MSTDLMNIEKLLEFGEKLLETTKDLTDAFDIYKLNYHDFLVKIHRIGSENQLVSIGNIILIQGCEVILRFLRIFGGLIKYIHLDETFDVFENVSIIEFSISECCQNNLNTIFLSNISIFSDLNFKFPMKNVVDIRFFGCTVHEKSGNIRERFPNVKYLSLVGQNNVMAPYRFIASLPKLEHFYCDVLSLSRNHLYMLKSIQPNLDILINVRAIEESFIQNPTLFKVELNLTVFPNRF